MQAAERAREASARREEASLLGQALEAATRLEDRQLVTELRAKRGQAFNAAAMWADAQRELEAALTGLAPDQAERRIAILVELAYASIFPSQGVERARAYATEALVAAERIDREDLAARALSALAEYDTNEGLLRESQPRFERAFARAGVDHIAELLTGLDQYGLNWYYLGHFEQADIYTRQALEIAQSVHDPAIITRTLGNLGMTLTGCGRYDEALKVFAEAGRCGHEYRTWAWLARSISMHAGLHLALGDYAGAEALTEEAREVNRAVRFPNVTASTGIDLLLMCARRHDVGRAEGLLPHVREGVTKASGSHGWLMALRFAQAHAEVALARGAWDEALRFAEEGIAQARLRGRVKYEVLGMQTHAQALAAQGRTKGAIAELRAAIALARPMGDPALFLRVVAALLAIEGHDALLTEARATVERIATALPGDLRPTFLHADTVRLVARLSH
jgi:tetratricopeptide (TPR) repeat protein